jgi:hypothetical protein
MNTNYVFLCGMVWAHFGEEDAGLELIRALASPDQSLRVLARTMLEQSADKSRPLIGFALACDEISADLAQLCAFENSPQSKLQTLDAGGWFCPASA